MTDMARCKEISAVGDCSILAQDLSDLNHCGGSVYSFADELD